jgi:hypothetical protein
MNFQMDVDNVPGPQGNAIQFGTVPVGLKFTKAPVVETSEEVVIVEPYPSKVRPSKSFLIPN